MISAILFDLDGVLVDACDWHYIALNRALKEICGYEIPRAEHESTFNALPTNQKLDLLISRGIVKDDERQRVWELKQELTYDTIRQYSSHDEEKQRMFEFIKDSGIKTACVTNSIYSSAQLMLVGAGISDYIDLVIASSDVKHPKPNGEPYATALVRLQVEPSAAVAVEDTERGASAAEAVGIHVERVSCAKDVTLEWVKRVLGEKSQ